MRLLEMLADKEKDDYFRHRLALAVLCLGEISSRRFPGHSALRLKIAEEFIYHWFDMLRNGEVRPYWLRNHQEAIRVLLANLDRRFSNIRLLQQLRSGSVPIPFWNDERR